MIKIEIPSGASLCGGKYVVEKTLGSGGFGITYLARHVTLGKKYAIKEFYLSGYCIRSSSSYHIIPQGIEEDVFNKLKQRFVEEAQTVSQLNNEAVVKVIDIFDENGTSYMVMPFVEGVTLQSMVENKGPLEYDVAVNYVVQICEALAYIHSQGILHRDVTPDNVLVTPQQKIVLIDFGSARKFVDNKTQRHTTIVKPGYAPLEQHSATSRKGAFTDLYSVGAVFYYLVTGKRPMDATERVLVKMKEPVELNHDIPAPINAIIMKAMEMDGANRYQSANEFINDIFSVDSPKDDKEQGNNDDVATVVIQQTPQVIQSATELGETSVIIEQPSIQKRRKQRHIVQIVALVLAFVAIASIVIVMVYYPFGMRNQTGPKTENVVQTIIPDDNTFFLAAQNQSEKEIADSLLQETGGKSILQELLTVDSKDPFLLYAIALKANDDIMIDEMMTFWDQVLIPEGDVNRHLTSNQDSFSLKKFAFVCGARAYENINDTDYPSDVKDKLFNSLTVFLDNLCQLEPKILIYDKYEKTE